MPSGSKRLTVATAPEARCLRVSAERPAYELDPPARLIDALRQAFGHFTPCDRAWIRVEGEMKNISNETNPAGHETFCRSFWNMDADDVIGFLVEHGLVENTRSTKPKKEMLDTCRIQLAGRLAKQKTISPVEALREVDAMNAQQFADAVAVEFESEVSAKTVRRWRDRLAKEAQISQRHSPSRVDDDADDEHEDDSIVDPADALPPGITSRTRIDGITRAKVAPEHIADEREGTRLLRRRSCVRRKSR